MGQKFADAARAFLASGISDSATALTIEANGSLFPVADTGTDAVSDGKDWFKAVLQDDDDIEIVYVRTHASGSMTFGDVLRGQEGTAARAFSAGSVVGIRFTAHDAAAMYPARPMLGEVRMLAGIMDRAGWVPCDGRLLDVDAYPAAAAALGIRWGGDGITTFGVPDMRNRFPLGVEVADIGDAGGAASVTLSNAHLPAQVTGSVTGQTINGAVTVNALNGDASPVSPSNTPTVTNNTLGKAGPNIFFPPGTTKVAVPTTHNLVVTGGNVTINGGGEPVPTVPPWAGVGFVIYVGAPLP